PQLPPQPGKAPPAPNRPWRLQQDPARILLTRGLAAQGLAGGQHGVPPPGGTTRPADHVEDRLRQELEQLVAIPYMPVQGRGLDVETLRQPTHRQAVEALVVHQLER